MKKILLFFSILLSLFQPNPVLAHAFGQKYTLPLPFWLYLYGGAAALLISFLIIGYFINQTNKTFKYPTFNLSKIRFFTDITNTWFVSTLRVVSVFLFLLTILTGLFGQNSSYSNFNMTFFWVIFLLGLTYLTAIIGNLWVVINPWKILVEWFEGLVGSKIEGEFSYPKWLSYWPALAFYFLLIWYELVGGTTPFRLSLLLTLYTILNFTGAIAFGKENWFRYCEFFSVFLGQIARIAPVEIKFGKIYLRPPFAGLLNKSAEHFSLLIFILFMLSSTAFDGFSSTIPWLRFSGRYLEVIIGAFLGENSLLTFQAVKTIGLLLSPLVFLYIYFALIALTKAVTKSKSTISELSLKFAFSLIPIALVYNIAHYYTLLLTEGQNIIRLISDPFGIGWNLFNTANYVTNVGIVGANFVWHSQVAFILTGHIVAVYLAHVVALRTFPTQKKALVSQFPMLVLMVIYTMTGLWILSQPLTTGF